jgi:hypothetical protein
VCVASSDGACGVTGSCAICAPSESCQAGSCKSGVIIVSEQTKLLYDQRVWGLVGSGDGSTVAVAGAGYLSISSKSSVTCSSQTLQKISYPLGFSDSFAFNENSGSPMDISFDGLTLVVGARDELGSGTGVSMTNVFPVNTTFGAVKTGAVFVFRRPDVMSLFSLEAYLKPAVNNVASNFGFSVSLSDDGNSLVVGAPHWSVSQGGGVCV